MHGNTKYNPYNLIVNFLPQSMTEGELNVFFSTVGKVKSSKIIKDKATGISFGYGFVEFVDDSNANLAIKNLDGKQLENKHIKVAFARQGANIKGANVYVKYLPKEYTGQDLNNLFSSFGKIVSARVLTDPVTGQSRDVGFVLFDTRDEAARAVQSLNGKSPPGYTQSLLVKFAEDNKEVKMQNYQMMMLQQEMQQQKMQQTQRMPQMQQPNPFNTGFNFSHNFPPLAPRVLPTNMIPRLPPPLGLGVGYQGLFGGGPLRSTPISQRYNPLSAMAPFNGTVPDMSCSNMTSEFVLFVYNIGSDTDERALWQLFSPFGAIKKVAVVHDSDKSRAKNYGFVTMIDYQEAMCAIQQLNGLNYTDKPLQVSLKKPKNGK